VPHPHPKLDSAVARAIGERLRETRLGRELTIESVAHDAGLAPKHLQVLERGAGNPTAATLYRLAGVLGVQARDLLPVETAPRLRRSARRQ
jgi:transcriptional regulator with XRE-family HTH domain